MASLKTIVKQIGNKLFNYGIPDYDTLVKHYTPSPIEKSREYRHFRNKVLPKRIKRLIRNYQNNPDNFERSSIEIIFREIDSVTVNEMHHIHNELTKQLVDIRNSVTEILSETSNTSNEISFALQELEKQYYEIQEYLTEYRRPVIAIENEEENLLPGND